MVLGSIPGEGTKIPQAAWRDQKQKQISKTKTKTKKTQMFYVNLMGNTKPKSTTDTQDKEKGIKAFHYRKSSTYKERQEREEKKRKPELQNLPTNNYSKY